MSLPALAILWHCAAAGLELTAAHQWNEARQLAALHEVDIDRALEPFSAIPMEKNFLSHPFLQACLLQPPESRELISMHATAFTLRDTLLKNLASMDKGSTSRLESILAEIESGDLPEKAAGKSTAHILFQYTEELDIPWEELAQSARRLPLSQMPVPGSIPPMDAFTPPLTAIARFENLFDLITVAELRSHALLALKKPESARECLLIQCRAAAALMDGGGLSVVTVGSVAAQKIINQIHAGFTANVWRDEDIQWFAEWAAAIDAHAVLSQSLRAGVLLDIRYIEDVSRNSSIPGLAARYFREDPELNEQFSMEVLETAALQASLPFDEESFSGLNDYASLIYRMSPAPAFKFWKASSVNETCLNHLTLLRDGGLTAYAWPERETRQNSPLLPYPLTGALMVSLQTKLNLLRTACALHQWRKIHGDLPQELESLTRSDVAESALPPSAIQDPYAGKPLIYERRSGKAYRLRSIGLNRRDDGGKRAANGKRDLVWK